MAVINEIRDAMKQRKLLSITYRDSKAQISSRVVESYKIKNGTLFYGFDVEKDEIRSFKLSGILKAEVLPETFVPRFPVNYP